MNNTLNRIHNSSNPYQGNTKKVLCVCSAGLLRSPTAALVLSMPPFNFNTRACGLAKDYALIPFDDVLAYWADEIVVMSEDQARTILEDYPNKKIICLDISDDYAYRDPKLISLIVNKYMERSVK